MTTQNPIIRDYIGRLNKVLDYIENNLDQELSLSVLSKIACFSPFHFHRLFTLIVKEPLNTYINRKRIERIASVFLMGTELPITELAFKYGFNSSSSFSRTFKKFYGVSPTEFKSKSKTKISKIGQVESKNGKVFINFDNYICSINNLKNWIKMNAKIEVKEMPELEMVYLTHIGDFDQIGPVYEKLFNWAGPKGLLTNDEKKNDNSLP